MGPAQLYSVGKLGSQGQAVGTVLRDIRGVRVGLDHDRNKCARANWRRLCRRVPTTHRKRITGPAPCVVQVVRLEPVPARVFRKRYVGVPRRCQMISPSLLPLRHRRPFDQEQRCTASTTPAEGRSLWSAYHQRCTYERSMHLPSVKTADGLRMSRCRKVGLSPAAQSPANRGKKPAAGRVPTPRGSFEARPRTGGPGQFWIWLYGPTAVTKFQKRSCRV